jgi:hypothetical protein
MHDTYEKEKGIEEIQSGSLLKGASLGELFVDEFISVYESTKINKNIRSFKRNIREITILDEHIRTENLFLKDSSARME